jgi:protein-S-isoprenylcysteine O-methyltransferase Ste14
MLLQETMERQGEFLFRWRSYLPLALVPAAVAALTQGAGPEQVWGETAYHVWAYACMVLSFSGLAIRWATVGFVPVRTSGRNTKAQRAETLNTTGLYSLTRNPLYLGNFVAVLGITASIGVWWFVAIVCLSYWLYIERIIATEEAFLARKFGTEYEAWAAETPAFFPSFRRWVSPTLPFSIVTLLRREYNGVLAVGAAFMVLEVMRDLWLEGERFSAWVHEDGVWAALLMITALTFVTLRTLKKYTDVLRASVR